MSLTMFTIHWATDLTEGYMSARGDANRLSTLWSLRRGVAYRVGRFSHECGRFVWSDWKVIA